MITDVITKSLNNCLINLFKDYFFIYPYFSPSLDPNNDIPKLFETTNQQNIKLLNNKDGRVYLLYNRSPFTGNELFRHSTEKMYAISKNDIKTAQLKEFVFGKITLNYKLITNYREVNEVFEILHAIKLRRNTDIEISVQLEDTIDTIKLVYNLNFPDISSFELVDFNKYGALWSCDFSVDIQGIFISPESYMYPRLLNIKTNFFVTDSTKELYCLDNYISTFNTEYILDEEGKITRIDNKKIRDVNVIISRFTLDE